MDTLDLDLNTTVGQKAFAVSFEKNSLGLADGNQGGQVSESRSGRASVGNELNSGSSKKENVR